MLYLVGGELITTTVNLLPGFRIELRKCNYTAEGGGAILGNLCSILFFPSFKSISFHPLLRIAMVKWNLPPYSLRHCDYGNIKFIERTRKWSFEPSSHAFANNLITADSSLSHLERCPSYPKSVVLWSFGYKSALLIYGSINSSAAKPNSSTMILNRFRCITEIGPLNELPRFSIHPGYPGINRNLNQRSSRIINKTDIYAIDASPPSCFDRGHDLRIFYYSKLPNIPSNQPRAYLPRCKCELKLETQHARD